MHFTRARSKPSYCIKKMWALLFFYTCDKISEMRTKNLTNISEKINQPLYVLINERNIGVTYST
jgi:hypothetical protein